MHLTIRVMIAWAVSHQQWMFGILKFKAYEVVEVEKNYMIQLGHKLYGASLPQVSASRISARQLAMKAYFCIFMQGSILGSDESNLNHALWGLFVNIELKFFQINSKHAKKYLKHFMKHCLIQIITYSNSFEFCDSTTDSLPLSWMKSLSNGSCTVLQAHMIE